MPYEIPPNLKKFLPSNTLSITAFITFAFPSNGAVCPPKFMRVKKFYSELPQTTKDASQVAKFTVPPESIIQALCEFICNKKVTIKSIVCQHNASGHRYPLHLVFYWKEVMHQYKIQWKKAVTNICCNLDNSPIYTQVNDILPHLPWTGNLTGYTNTINIHQLSAFLTEEWLTNDHELMMLDILKQDLATANYTNSDNVFIENTAFLTLLTVASHNQQDYNSSKAYKWIRTWGRDLASGQKRYLATIVNQDNVHWTALLLDFKTGTILFGDSYRNSMPPDLQSVLEWWIQHHIRQQFTHKKLTISHQTDHFSCGMLAWYALHCHLLSNKLQVQEAMVGRAEIFV